MLNPPDVIPVKCGLGSLTHWYRRMDYTDVYMYEGPEGPEGQKKEESPLDGMPPPEGIY